MGKEKACLKCRNLYTETVCPNCGEAISSESFKGRVYITDHEKSEIARNMKIKHNGKTAVKTK